ncbi:helix-turn-helix domain-containing protein [Micromonospora sp. PSH03]|uniref:ATP-binding protein n=1 Tax=Micromonospora TaxID=1873 RepID=UPI001B374AE0|nr:MULTISPECIES: helix-turn-helix domain-containing protein [Micromonospora]MBQ0990160.1 XRE family transcriptional regulator [Micromonospora sp. H61]MCG5453853.1 helix-turn-helix domain-containing protein [Micromonospora salmantinae]
MTPDHDWSRSPAGRTTLPELLRGHRRAAGLTQAELASRAGVGVRTVRDLERGRSIRPQRTTVELLAGALALTGTSRAVFLAAARGAGAEAASPDATSTAFAVGGNATSAAAPADPSVALPPPVALIGRERDLTELAGMLTAERGPRLVSLVGLAGVGKTALATSVAHLVAAAHPAGVAGVLVGEGADGPDVLAASMSVLGVARLPELVALLAGRPTLLVMDAVERAPGPVAATVHRLLGALPSLRVLVTGRHPVGLPGERVWPVAPLDVPPPEAEHSGLESWPAVALFTARLAQVRREPPTPVELPALAALVRRLGGLPLAIELMAARGRLLDLTELLDRYGDRVLDLATPADASAHPAWDAPEALGSRTSGPDTRAAASVAVTLRDAVAFSYRLLASDEQAALRQLAVFGNRWSVELAEEMLADEADRDGAVAIDPVPLLDRFVELGLLSVRGTGSFRFRLLDAVRDYAVEQAAGGGELTCIRRRHAEVIARLVARTASDLIGPRLPDAVHRLDEMSSDISSSLAHAATDDPLTALRLAACLTRWWRFRGRDVAGRQWLRRLLADPRTADADPLLRGWAALGVARLATEHGAGAEELSTARAALDTFRQAGDVTGELEARNVLGTLLISVGRQDEAREQAEALLRLAARNGRTRDLAVAQNSLAWHEIRAGDLAAARRRLAAVDRLAAESGEQRLRVLGWANRAEVARLEGWYADAIDRGRRAIAALSELGDPGRRRRVLGTVGLALAQDGRAAEATEVLTELRAGGMEALPARPAVPRPRSDDAALAWGGPEAGLCALIEGNLALHRGDRELAAEWFAAAADHAGQDRRDVVEALVGLAASTADPSVLDRLDRVCVEGGIRLLPQESGLLYALIAARGGPAR